MIDFLRVYRLSAVSKCWERAKNPVGGQHSTALQQCIWCLTFVAFQEQIDFYLSIAIKYMLLHLHNIQLCFSLRLQQRTLQYCYSINVFVFLASENLVFNQISYLARCFIFILFLKSKDKQVFSFITSHMHSPQPTLGFLVSVV